MPDLDTTIADGDPGHALLHQDANVEVNSLRGRMATAESTITSQGTTLSQKYTKPAQGIPGADLDSASQAKLAAAVVTTTSATTRPAGAMCIWNGADPGTNATAGVDLFVGEVVA